MSQMPPPPPGTPPDLAIQTNNSLYLLLGVYGWEYLRSLQVEGELISGQLPFRPSLIPYILGRMSLLVFFILRAVGTSPWSNDVDCPSRALTVLMLGGIAVACSSTNFMIRTWVIWKDSRLVHALLFLLALGQWTLLVVGGVFFKSINMDGVCDIYPTSSFRQMNAIPFIYITVLDLLVLVLSVAGLSTQPCTSPLKRRLRAQAIVYVAIAGIVNIPPMVFALLNNTAVFDFVVDVDLTISIMTSSWAVRSLLFLDTPDSNQESEIALTTNIAVQSTTTGQEDGSAGAQHSVRDKADRC
ncbi:hypothetical protein V8E55_003998 [Tylopilus felleus]